MQPWHAKVEFRRYNAQSKPAGEGTVEEWWYGSDKWRLVYAASGYVVAYEEVAGEIYETGSFPPASAEGEFTEEEAFRIVHDALFMPVELEAAPEGERVNMHQLSVGGPSLRCLSFTYNSGKTAVSATLPEYCFDKSSPIIRIKRINRSGTLFNEFVSFQGRLIGKSISYQLSGVERLNANVTILEALNGVPAAQLPAPAPGSMKLSQPYPETIGATGGLKVAGSPPSYPLSAKQNHEQGIVSLHAVIAADGTVGQITTIRSPSPQLTSAAEKAVRDWRYTPFTLGGKPVAVGTTVHVAFKLGP